MKIIIELSLCINLIINAFILKSTGLFFKEKARLWFLTSALGSAVALILPICHVPSYLQLIVEILLASLMVSISFNFKSIKRFLSIYGVFLGMTFIFGGGCYALEQIFGQLPLFCVLIVACVIYLSVTAILKARNRIRTIENFSYKVKLVAGGKEIEEEGYLDSGNMLCDPITKRPIVLISFDVFSKIYENINFLNAYMKKVDTNIMKEGHYVKINSVSSGTSILVFTADKMEISRDEEKQCFEHIAVGLSFSGFEKALGRKILLNSQMV